MERNKTNLFNNYQNLDPNYIPNNMFLKRHPEGIRDIIRGTTCEHFVVLPFELNRDVDYVLITYKQGLRIKIEKNLWDLHYDEEHPNVAYYQFTQEETSRFEAIGNTPCEIQVKARLKNHDVIASDIYTVKVLDVLSDEEI